jgi:hypothetical protein
MTEQIIVTMEYQGEDYPPQITKETLKALQSNLGSIVLKTNMGIDLHSTDVFINSTGHYYDKIKIERLDDSI